MQFVPLSPLTEFPQCLMEREGGRGREGERERESESESDGERERGAER